MIHTFRDKKNSARRRKTVRTIIGFAIFLLLAGIGALSWGSGFLHFIGRPIWKAENVTVSETKSLGYLVRTKSSVFRENENLTQENARLQSTMLDYQILKNENDQLKALFNRIASPPSFILAAILAKPNRSPYDTLIVDGGNEADISEKARVYAEGNIPLGEVSRVYAQTALVTLYSNPGSVTEAVLEGSNASVELVGRGGGNFEMMIPLELSADKGSFVVLPNLTNEIIAIVEEIISSPTDPVKRVILRSPVNIQALQWVEIKKN
ncbi:MAG: rod shape-determining protein MreC [Patescibacteria group bacterium]